MSFSGLVANGGIWIYESLSDSATKTGLYKEEKWDMGVPLVPNLESTYQTIGEKIHISK